MKRGAWLRQSAVALVLVAGCATPGPKQALEPIEAELDGWASVTAAEPAAPVTANWLDDLQDPQVSRIVERAVTENYDIQAAGMRVLAARNQARVTRAGMLPSLSAGLNGSRSGGPVVFNGQQFADQFQTNFDLGVSVDWELDVWGRLTDRTRAAYLDASAQELDYAAARLSLAGNAARSYYDVTTATLQRQLAERDVETGEVNLRIIERRYERGISTSLDLRLARSSLATSRATLKSRQQAELEAKRRLEVLLGQYPSATVASAADLPDPNAIAASAGALGLGTPEELLARRPDIVAAERRLKASGLRVSEARKAFLPSLSLRASATENALPAQGSTVAEFEDLFDFDLLSKRLVGNLTQPIFQGGRLIANERAAKANARAALYDYATTALTAWREVEDAIAAEDLLTARQEALELAFEEAKAAEDLTERRYLAGTTNIFDLINAQQRRIAAEGQLIDAKRARLSNRIDLYLALGAPYLLESERQLAVAEDTVRSGAQSQGDVL
ncbi:efflux transporter outer membrane subunit [Parvularcula lutaonensis]|uniref:Efflux transporter outer membrane subunit n=1 Tax=Parvularcula lutaonensis TaxID=491923 RepID=A0ABV7MGD0_9PROT|nr:efflux transporter outer membrane subunit [Parvularcula lutaonensis]GGY54063.1 adeC/adeK/oprM family multidrug efflux complex outer membrane factor [Parvularcula lutaonensis]